MLGLLIMLTNEVIPHSTKSIWELYCYVKYLRTAEWENYTLSV